MKKVTGIGGIFFTCKDVETTKAWYQKHLGLPIDDYGCTFFKAQEVESNPKATFQWSVFKDNTDHFNAQLQAFMINYRVTDLHALINELVENGVEIDGEIQEYEYGKFAWIIDCDGRKVELWEPSNEELFEN